MKSLSHFIIEKLKISNVQTSNIEHTLFPESKEELIKMIKDEMDENGNTCDLNHIDVSGIDDMSFLFSERHYNNTKFNGDISQWDVSNVTNMNNMFGYSKFNGDISKWDVSSVTNMSHMFYVSAFTGKNSDISDWDVSNVKDMSCMFTNSL